MKKLTSIALSCLLALTLCAAASAEAWSHEESGVTVTLPEGMTATDISEEGLTGMFIESGDETAPMYYIYLEYDEAFAEKWMEDLDEEALQSVAEYYALSEGNYTYHLMDSGTATLMVMGDEENNELLVVALLGGWFISVEAAAYEGYELDMSVYEDVLALLAGITLPE